MGERENGMSACGMVCRRADGCSACGMGWLVGVRDGMVGRRAGWDGWSACRMVGYV